jgi:hypothetical protein
MRTDKEVMEMLDNMSDFEISRWQALMDAVGIVAEKAADRKIKWDTLDIKPSAIEHYIEATCDIYCRRLMESKEAEKQKAKQRAKTILPNLVNAINKCDKAIST